MNAQTVADDILKLAKRRGLELTPMQLVKLAYIAYGWYLAIYEKNCLMIELKHGSMDR